MAFNLGIDLGDERVSAAFERGGTMRMVSFGATRHAPLQVHVGRDGTISAGTAAVAAGVADPAGLVGGLAARLGDPRSMIVNGYAVTGETLLAHLLAHVREQAAAQAGDEPLRHVVLAHPPSWTPATRSALVAAASQAGLADAEAVPVPRALERAPDNARHLPEQAPALGAAVLATMRARSGSSSAAGGARSTTRPSRPAAPLATSSPTSVFDATDPGASRPTRGTGGAGGVGGGGPRPPTGADGVGDGVNRVPFVIAGAALLVLLVVLAIVLVTRDNSSDAITATGATGGSAATSITSAPPPSSTTSTASTSSTTSTTTTTKSTTTTIKPASTTTAISAPTRIGSVALADNGLVLQFGSASSNTSRFGDNADSTLSRVVALVGQASSDTGWKQAELCIGDETRRVVFGNLELVFTKNASGVVNGSRTFEQWFVDEPGKQPDGLVTLDRIGIGSTVADLRRVYGAAMKIGQPIVGDPTGLFSTSEGGTAIDGITTGTSDRSSVRQMWAGTACQRVAD